jgi:membrane protein YqaA with SNARE-associated domain
MTVFSLIGGYLPILFGASWLSFIALLGNGIGGIVGVVIGYKLRNYWGLE